MARSFWEFIRVEKNIEMCDRDHVSICFREYIAKTTFAPQDNVNANANHSMIRNNTRKRNTALEAQTLARMRQLRLAKTIRADNYTVLAMFCHPQDRKFPSKDDQTRKKNELKSDLENAKENKEGVIVSELPDRVTGSIGEMEILQFHIEEEVPGAWDGGSRKLIGLEIRGSHGHKFQLSSTIPTLPLNIFESADVAITVTPQKIGVMRAKVIFIFESFVISRAITMSCGHAEMNRVLQPTSPYKRKRRARVVTYPSKENTVGPPPKQEGARSNTENNPFQNLNHYQVPIEVHKAIRDETYDDDVEQTGWRTSSGHDSLNGYGNYWKHLLWAQESQANRDIQMYDMDHVRLKKEGRLYLLTVPGLAESRPSVLRGDLVHITFNGCLYKGRVVVIRQLEVVLDLHSKFSQTYSPGIDHVSVHFTFSRMTYRTCHKACEEMGAEQAMGARMLIPTKENISGMMEHACPICFDQLGGAGNAPFTTTYCRGQCGADFHETCIQRWLGQEQHQANPTCPTCREPWVEGTATNDRPIGGDSNKNVTLVPWANRGLNPEQQQAVQRVANGTLRPLPYVSHPTILVQNALVIMTFLIFFSLFQLFIGHLWTTRHG